MSTLPTGIVTFLFTDIEGSTRLWDRYPEAMAEALERHDALLRRAIESAGGYVFKTVGDAFCAAFASAVDGVLAVEAAQRALHSEAWPENVAIRVRMALNTGAGVERDGDYFGPAVNRTARLEALAHGGQVLISRSTADQIDEQLPLGLTLADLGSHALKDLDLPENVFQLMMDGLPADFPPLRAHVAPGSDAQAGRTNLTELASSFVGRDVEVAEIVSLLGANRVVTLTGSGGVGKTRLSNEVGKTVLDATRDGVWMVELATVTDPALVASEVLGDLGITELASENALATLIKVLGTQDRLVILDNCEQVIDGCAEVADALVRNCPAITLLSTSREPLRIEGEVIYRVPSLSLPPEHVDGREDLANSGAVALFVERASAQVPGFELSDDVVPLVASICRRLDGMPLALELATARLRSMSLSKLHDRLERRFDVLTGGNRVALPRQQTLRALVDWSYDILSAPEQALFRRVSVFVDGFDLDAAEGLCGLDDISEDDVVDLLSSLVDKSLVVAEPNGSTLRYRLLETLRQYGAERLAEAPVADAPVAEAPVAEGPSEAERVATAHSAYYLSLAERAAPHLDGRSSREWVKRLDDDELNLRSAIDNALGTAEGADRVLRQFQSLHRYWHDARQPAQTLILLERALERVGPHIAPGRRAEALLCKVSLLSSLDLRLQLEAATEALDLARQSTDRALETDALSKYCRCLEDNGRHKEALSAGAQAVALAREIGDPLLLGRVLFQYGIPLEETDPSGAESAYLEALGLFEQCGDVTTACKLHNNFALFLLGQGDLAAARSHFETAVDMAGDYLPSQFTTDIHTNLGWLLVEEGDCSRAALYFTDVLRTNRLNGRTWLNANAVLGLACCATADAMVDRAAILHGGASALLSTSSDQWEPVEGSIRAKDLEVLRERLGSDFEPKYMRGLGMRNDEIIRLALTSDLPSDRPSD